MDSFYQGYRLQQEDLNTEFWRQNIYYPPPFCYRYSPYWVRYQVGYVPDNIQRFYRIGTRYRIPDELDTGVFRPNFIVGEDWGTGNYQIRWLYMDYENSAVEEKYVGFTIITAGIYDGPMTGIDHKDLRAEFTLLL